jgi:hypothetical protein
MLLCNGSYPIAFPVQTFNQRRFSRAAWTNDAD